jgi:hypothetical protein
MSTCASCGNRFFLRRLSRRLAIPEYRAMTGFWPWTSVSVCDACLEGYDREFTERLHLLAPQVLENDEPVAEPVCLSCGTVNSPGPWREASRWIRLDGRPTRRATFYLCSRHGDLPYVEGIVVSSNLKALAPMKSVLTELPTVGGDLLERVEHWRPETGQGPAGGLDFTAGLRIDQAAQATLDYWQAAPEGMEARAAWLGPIRKDYRMRYRLDLVRDFPTGRREVLTVVRTALDRFTTYRKLHKPPAPHAPHAV